LTVETLAQVAPDVPAEALSVLQPEDSVRRRESLGGPGPKAMEEQLRHARALHEVVGFPKFA
jgi:argininosuccinate lyase